jgi:hypothetical protein
MPNWVTNQLTISGTPKEVENFIRNAKTIDDEQEILLSFNKFWPCPPELQDISHPVTIITNKEYKDNGPAKGITKKMQNELIKKYGFDNWYDWQLANWGTKWDCDVTGEWKIASIGAFIMNGTLEFLTAWSPPSQAFIHISKRFPKLTFILKFVEPGMCFAGSETYQKGENIENEEYSMDSDIVKSLLGE